MKTILLLHGAIGAKDQLQLLAKALEANYEVHTLSFSGHGGETFPDEGFSIKTFAGDVIRYLTANNITQTDIFGYSMGGYVALYLAKYFSEKAGKVVTLATKFHWDEQTATKEVAMLDADKISTKLPAFADSLHKRHLPNDWKEVLLKTKDMLLAMGADNPLKPSDYETIEKQVLVLLGDRDKMITLDETLQVYKTLPNAQMAMLPNTPHPIEQVDVDYLSFVITKFIN